MQALSVASRAKSADYIIPKLEVVGNRKKRTTSMVERSEPKNTSATTEGSQNPQQPKQKRSLDHTSTTTTTRHNRRDRSTSLLKGKSSKSPVIPELSEPAPSLISFRARSSTRCRHELKRLRVDELLLMNTSTEKKLFEEFKETSFYNIHILWRYQAVQLSHSYAQPFAVGCNVVESPYLTPRHFGVR